MIKNFIECILLAYFPLALIFSILVISFDKKWVFRNKMNKFICEDHKWISEITSTLFTLSMGYHLYIGFKYY